MQDPVNGSTQQSSSGGRAGAALLILFSLAVCLTGLGGGPPLGDHECINAQAARQIRQSGEWLIPRLGEIPRIRKTPLGIWLIATASKVFDDPTRPPVTEFSARLPSALASIGTALVLYWLGGLMYGRRGGLVAGFVWAGSVAAILFAHNAQVDMVLTFATALTFACFYRGAIHEPRSGPFVALFFAAFALAMMAKAPLPVMTVGAALCAYWFLAAPLLTAVEQAAVVTRASGLRADAGRMPAPQGDGPAEDAAAAPGFTQRLMTAIAGRFRQLPVAWIVLGVVLFVIIAGAWPLYVYRHVPNALALWRAEYLDRATGELSEKRQPLWYYLPFVLAFVAPYTLSLFEALASPFLRRYREVRKPVLFAFVWAVVGTVLLSLPPFKRPHYILSVMPAYSLLLTPVIERLFWRPAKDDEPVRIAWPAMGVNWCIPRGRALLAVCLAVPVLLAIGFAVGGLVLRKQFPGLVPAYAAGAAAAACAWTAAAWVYRRGRGPASFALLNLGTLALVLLAVPGVGRHVNPNADSEGLVAALREHGIRPTDRIILVDGRPDSSIEFYHGYRLERLIDEIEMTTVRRNRRDTSLDVLFEFAARIRQRLREPRPVYLVLSAANYSLLEKNLDVRPRVVFRLPDAQKSKVGGIVVITQPS